MIKLLAKIFIKNSNDFKNTEVRGKYGVLCGAFGIFLNILLFAGKFIAGLLTLSVAITADAFNNLSDAGSSIISMLGFKLAGKKPDSTHPFGHGRMEYIAGLIVSFLIILMGFELGKTSIENIRNPKDIEFNWVSIIILSASILVKLYMALYNKIYAKKIESSTMSATGTDSISDAVSTSVVLISIIVSKFCPYHIDGIAGLLVSAFIIYSGISAARETIHPLLGESASKEFVKEIEETVLAHKNIKGIHDLVVHDYGPGRLMISLHAEVDGKRDPFDIHDEIDCIEEEMNKKFNCETVIHTDPIEVDNEELSKMKKDVDEIVKGINPDFTIHDFRFVPGETHTNLIFDVVLEPKYYDKQEEIRKQICNAVGEKHHNYFCVIKFDKRYYE